ncbi:brix domain-containing protein [Tubulinosema ratisbonensis]|uniref:Brix domain-containing protein n=1 Tax=Tubulinosema ratisbonensis TaxID=291195 RepID=A0A437APS3_9MICR|nr:brix domain-containing protein [Tubulinosema ratisbonensis]
MLIAINIPKNACKETQELAKELSTIIPYTFISEEKTDLNIQIIEYNNIRPYKLIIKDLEGEIEFKIVEYLSKKKLNNNLIITEDSPQLIVNNFSTSLGGSVVNWLEKLFPCKIEGRQVVTFQCQNDFIFFRMYRYIFRNEKIDFQNIGPHLCLRLVKLKNKEEEFVIKKYEKKITIL